MTDALAVLIPALGWALLHFVWQGVVVGLLAWLALQLLRNARPQARYAVACIALVACVLLPVWQILQSLGSTPQAAALAVATSSAVAEMATSSSQASMTTAWPSIVDRALFDGALPWIVVLWATGAAALSLRMLFGLAWIRRLRAAAQPDTQRLWQARLDALALRFGIRRPVALGFVADGDSPVSIGWWRPVVLVPMALAARMPTDLLEALLAHELAHIRRHDYLVNLVQSAIEALLFYHPVVWWLSRRIRIERELVADDLAAATLGEPRRLAVALSELDRFALPSPQFAQAAHGGQLMSRIQQLIRPDRRAIGGKLAFPLLGLAAACIAFYAHAQIAQRAAVVAPVAVTGVTAPVAAIAAVAPATASVSAAAAAPKTVTAASASIHTIPTLVANSVTRLSGDDDHETYAVVHEGRQGIHMSGEVDDVDDIKAAQRSIDGDFLWFRRDGKAYIVRDPALLARIERENAPAEAIGQKMEVLSDQMQVHSVKMEEFSRRMEALSVRSDETPAMREAAAKIEALGDRQMAIASDQMKLATAMRGTDEAHQAQLDRQMEVLNTQQEALNRQMEGLSDVLEAESEKLEDNLKPLEALSRQMEESGKPMEALGKQIEILGEQMETTVTKSERVIRGLIDDAYAKGLATPAPSQQ